MNDPAASSGELLVKERNLFMLSIQRKPFVPIHKTEEALATKQAADEFEAVKRETIKMVQENFSDFDMSKERILVTVDSLANFPETFAQVIVLGEILSFDKYSTNVTSAKTLDEAIMQAADKKELNRIKQAIVFSALYQLGAIYSKLVQKSGHRIDGRIGRVIKNITKHCYDSPTLGIQVNVDNALSIERVLHDIPLLINKTKELTKKAQEQGIKLES